jgi:hypothetical protein
MKLVTWPRLFSPPQPLTFRERYAALLRDLAARGIRLESLAYLGERRIIRFVRVRDQMQRSLGPARWAALVRALDRQDPRMLRFLDSFRCDEYGCARARS